MYEHKIPPIDLDCGVTMTLHVIGGKWKPYLINCITKGFHQPKEFQKIITGATKRVLVKQLGELEIAGVVRKVTYDTVPIIRMIDKWGLEHKALFNEMGLLSNAQFVTNEPKESTL